MSLVADAIVFGFGARPVLDGISVAIHPGEIVALQAPSGRGKTTLGRILAGYLRPHGGRVTLDGAPPPERRLHPVQMIHQTPHAAVNPRWRMAQVLRETGALDAAPWRAFGVEPAWLDRFPNELSGGQLQRVVIARALAPGVRYLVADEITSQLDTISQAEIWRCVAAAARERGVGVLAITHDADLAGAVASRFIHLPDAAQASDMRR